MPKAIRGDHTIATATPRTADASTLVRATLSDAVRGTSPIYTTNEKATNRKTPSPKPPSLASLRTKTPSPTLANVGNRTSSSVRGGSPKALPSERLSPTQGGKSSVCTERTSPTQGKGPCSPTQGLVHARVDSRGARSASANACFTPTPPTSGVPRPLTARLTSSIIRSKSVTSNAGDLLVATEIKARSAHRRIAADAREVSTQTICDVATETFAAQEAAIAREIAAISEIAKLEPPGVCIDGFGGEEDREQTGWLDQHIRMQGELEMALRSGMELIAERTLSLPSPPLPHAHAHVDQPPVGTRRPGARHARAGATNASAAAGVDQSSDGEGHEDDEVRSLSLSEDGPVIRRFPPGGALEDSRCAPDPIAMLSDGQRHLTDRFARRDVELSVSADQLHEQGSDLSSTTPIDSDQSAAFTQVAVTSEPTDGQGKGRCCMPRERQGSEREVPNVGFSNVFEHLTPILSKVAGNLEAVQENADVTRERSHSVTGGMQVQATRVRALRCSSSVESLNLSEVQLCDNPETRSRGARSDISFGSESSAFTCLSSSTSGSHSTFPGLPFGAHRHRPLKETVSMPSLSSESSMSQLRPSHTPFAFVRGRKAERETARDCSM